MPAAVAASNFAKRPGRASRIGSERRFQKSFAFLPRMRSETVSIPFSRASLRKAPAARFTFVLKPPASPLSPLTTMRTTFFSGRVARSGCAGAPSSPAGTRDATDTRISLSVFA